VRCHALALVVGWGEVLVVAGHVANETKENICCPSMPKGPTLKRHITTNDKLEDIDRAMQVHSLTITSFSQRLFDSVKLCNKLVVLIMSLLISLSGYDNGHICTLDSGGVLALHT
jgi:hypothetical protein